MNVAAGAAPPPHGEEEEGQPGRACCYMSVCTCNCSVHDQIIQSALESAVFVGNSLVNMYAKCGSIEDAWRVFDKMPS
jgi:pentatricopeptide repeat protein